jgi:hypothetical protein
MTTDHGLTITLNNDGLAVAYARMVHGQSKGEPFAYMEVPQCPLCGERHTHSAEPLYNTSGRLVGYGPSYNSRREAACTQIKRQSWLRHHPEIKELKLEHVYVLMPESAKDSLCLHD